MGQIVGGAAKPKRCNLNKLSQLGTPAAGEHILVSSDNSMNAAGQGHFDSYIVGDGQKAAIALELRRYKAEELYYQINGGGGIYNIIVPFTEGTTSYRAAQNIYIPKGTYNVSFANYSEFISSMTVYLTYDDDTSGSFTLNALLKENTFVKNIKKVSFYGGNALKTGNGTIVFADVNAQEGLVETLNNHVNNNSNPHNVTASQIGLGNVNSDIEELKASVNGRDLIYTPSFTLTSGAIINKSVSIHIPKGTYTLTFDTSKINGGTLYIGDINHEEIARFNLANPSPQTISTDGYRVVLYASANNVIGSGEVVFTLDGGRLEGITDKVDDLEERVDSLEEHVYEQVVSSGNGNLMQFDFAESEPMAFQIQNCDGEIEKSAITVYIKDGDGNTISTTVNTFNISTPLHNNDGWCYFVLPTKTIKSISFYGLGHSNKYPYKISVKNGDNKIGYWTYDSNNTFRYIDAYGYDLLPKYYWEDCWILNKIDSIKSYLNTCASDSDIFFFITDMHYNYSLSHLVTENNPLGLMNALQSPKLMKYIARELDIKTILDGGDRVHNGTTDMACRKLRQELEDAIGCNNVFITYGNHEFIKNDDTFDSAFSAVRTNNYDVVYGDSNRSYYYVDNPASKMRYISLCANGPWPAGGSKTENYPNKEAQKTWLATAMNVPNGWNVVIFSHFTYTIAGSTDGLYVISGTQDIIDAISQNNTNNQVACVLHGHAHGDRLHKNENDNFYYVISQADQFGTVIDGDIRTTRELGTTTEQHFEVVVVNKKGREIKLFAIGSPALNGQDNDIGTEVDVRTITF